MSRVSELIDSERAERRSIYQTLQQERINVELLEMEAYLNRLHPMIEKSMRKFYNLPTDLWQMQQTNGFKAFKHGALHKNLQRRLA